MGITPQKCDWAALVIPILGAVALVLIVLGALLPTPPKPLAPLEPERETPLSRCIDNGGIPVTSIWDGRVTNCIFPPERLK